MEWRVESGGGQQPWGGGWVGVSFFAMWSSGEAVIFGTEDVCNKTRECGVVWCVATVYCTYTVVLELWSKAEGEACLCLRSATWSTSS